ncbi:MAG: UDP-4-amino-4-deoxy-L-arabinose--oxoglutarate aminotransferase [Ignavibacteriaceae bacterium]|nr:UDP-4-amino-4-deoxy-L-arabinose--oxoglutarate aminotransferase [Ignavibacteriaceae bacterium]
MSMTEKEYIHFHRPYMDDEEIHEVADTIRSGWLSVGPKTLLFEERFREYIGSKYAAVVNSWTAAGHLALEAIGLKEGDEVIIPTFTFPATAEIICYFKAKPVLVDIHPDSMNMDVSQIESRITSKTRAIIPVHYGGLPCDMDEINQIAKKYNLTVIEDAAHALPSWYKGKKVGTLSDITCFSFYATKTLATGEGGMVCSDNEDIQKRVSVMRLHGIDRNVWNRYANAGSWYFEVIAPGYKYNFTDIHAALGIVQLRKLEEMWTARKRITGIYDKGFTNNELLTLPKHFPDRESSYHLYAVRVNQDALSVSRDQIIQELKEEGIGTSMHFIPVHRHPFYRDTFKLDLKDYPHAEHAYHTVITLPIYPGLSDKNIERVIETVSRILQKHKK